MTADRRGALVLVVEDDPDLVALLEMILVEEGYQVDTARHGAEALDRVAARMPAVILLDMRMPVMNGWEFARAFAARHDRAAPIVVVTAAEDAQARAREIGADAWLEKPFDIDDVLRTVDRFALARGDAHAPP